MNRLSVLTLSPLALAALLLAGCGNGNSASSPTSTSTTQTSSGGAPSAESSASGGDCYVALFDGNDFDEKDDNFKLTTPGRYANLDDLPGANDDWTDEADSVRVGRAATVTIWPETDFQGESQKLEPGSEHPNIDEEPSSLEMTC